MSETLFDQEENGFTFTDQDFERRYAAEGEAPPTPSAGSRSRTTVQRAKSLAARIHGGGNSFMRARRRRLLASGAS
jgi:hypothetical protein